MRASCVAFLVLSLGGLAVADDGIPLKTLQEIKAATVFLKVKTGPLESSGTGFVVQAQGETVYLVTNHHVVQPSATREVDDDRRGPFPFPFPRGPFGRPRVVVIGADAKPELTAVFYSGTRQEQSVAASVVLSDEARDLALLEVRGLKTAPKAIITDQDAQLVETTPVFVFGFPFGEALSENEGNPAISVGKGTISSLREDKQGELTTVQIDGALNPGNSGGPVVDGQGRLVGVAVATIKGAGIGMAIPQQVVKRMLAGRAGDLQIASRAAAAGQVEFEASVPLVDPFRQVKSVTLLYVARDQKDQDQQDQAKEAGQKADGPLAGSKKVDLKIQDRKATARFSVPAPEGAWVLVVQSATVQANGKTVYSTPNYFGMGAARTTQNAPRRPAATPASNTPANGDKPDDGKRRLSASGAARMLQGLKSHEPDEVARMLQTLKTFAPGDQAAEITAVLEKLLGSADAGTRQSAAEVLETWGRAESATALTKALGDTEADVRQAAMGALAKLKTADGAEAIAARLADAADRESASQCLVAIGAACEAAVCKLLKDKSPETRAEACRILSLVGTAKSLTEVEALVKDPDPAVAEKAAEAVKKIGGRN